MSASALVIGGTIEGIQATLDIADSGIEVILIESSHELPIKGESAVFLRPKLLEIYSHPNIRIMTGVDVQSTSGKTGAFKTTVTQRARYVHPQASKHSTSKQPTISIHLLTAKSQVSV